MEDETEEQKKERMEKRLKTLAELTALSQEMGLYDDDEDNPLVKDNTPVAQ